VQVLSSEINCFFLSRSPHDAFQVAHSLCLNSLQEFLRNKFYTLVEELVTQISLAHEQRIFHRCVLIVMGNNVKKIVKMVEKAVKKEILK
jgi:hypothetical protein